jgi:GNAT superfamily N-acetyltransferase
MIQITSPKSHPASELFHPLEHHMLIHALFENNLEAQLFVDNPTQPKAGLIAYKNRFVFGGDPNQKVFNADLLQYFTETMIPPKKDRAFLATFISDAWIPTLNELFKNYELILDSRLYFEIALDSKYEFILPDGFSLQHVTPEFLASSIRGLEPLMEEIHSERISLDDFFAKGFGLCPVYENQIAGWCLSEYNTGDRCEIGIATLEPHQRKGIATALTKAFLAEAAQRGYRHVGWKCWERNEASVATARKAGLSLVGREQALVAILK